MPEFIAIPVTQGDAFYLKRDDFSVLVDGGRRRSGFPSMFQAITESEGVNVLVCTHNDADHANGILGFLEAGLDCEELWLPGRWLAILPKVLRPFAEVFAELAVNVAQNGILPNTDEGPASLSPLEAYEERQRGRFDEPRENNDEISVEEQGWPESYVRMLERTEPWEVSPWIDSQSPDDLRFYPYRHYPKLGAADVQLLWSAIDAASRIRAIAVEAFHRGVQVRWFEFDVAMCSGGNHALRPINARGISRMRPWVGSLLLGLALTVSNKESLAFWSPPAGNQPGVLFTADSDLARVRLPSQLHRALATAPHHGSEANASAYGAVAAAAQQDSSSITWVRSDGRYRTRPGGTYLALCSRRMCTLCRLAVGSTTKQAVQLFSRRGAWIRHRATAECSCQ